jgi:predicted GIY-YIG superfamily endonuclease
MTWSVPARFKQHLTGLGCKYISKHGIKRLVYAEEHTDITIARQREVQTKDWSRAKKEQLIIGVWHADW